MWKCSDSEKMIFPSVCHDNVRIRSSCFGNNSQSISPYKGSAAAWLKYLSSKYFDWKYVQCGEIIKSVFLFSDVLEKR